MANENGVVSDDNIDADGKIPYDCTPISRKVEGGFFPNTYSDNNLNEEIKIYENNLKKKRKENLYDNINLKRKNNTSKSENIIKTQSSDKKYEKEKANNNANEKKTDNKENKESLPDKSEEIKNVENKNEDLTKLDKQSEIKNENNEKKIVEEQKKIIEIISNKNANNKNIAKNSISNNQKTKKHINQKNNTKNSNNVNNIEKNEKINKNTSNFEKNKTSEAIKSSENNEKKIVKEKPLTISAVLQTDVTSPVIVERVESEKTQLSEDKIALDKKVENIEIPKPVEIKSDINKEHTIEETKNIVVNKTEQTHSEKVSSKEGNIGPTSKIKSLFCSKNIINVLIVAVTIMFLLNIVLSTIVIISIRNGGKKVVYVNNNSISVNGNGITASAVRTALDSSVCIATGGIFNDEESFYNKSKVCGSGVIYKVNEDYSMYIITCYHVIKDNKNTIYVMLSCYLKPLPASIVGYSEKHDIAVIKVNNVKNIDGFNAILQGNSQQLAVGESVFAIGNQISSGFSTTSGIISKLNALVDIDGLVFREIQIDAPINHGNSGGGLFDVNGKFIGLVNAKYPSSSTYVEGISYAFPGTMVLSTVDSIIRNGGSPTYIDIGVSFKHDKEVGAKLEGNKFIEDYVVRVEKVENNSDAENKLKVDDIIQSFTWKDVYGKDRTTYMYNEYCLDDIKYMIQEGSVITFNISRPLYNIDSIQVSFKVTNLHT